MKNRVLAVSLILLLAFNITACGATESKTASTASKTEESSATNEKSEVDTSEEKEEPEAAVTPEVTEEPKEEKIEDSEDYKELEALGDVEVENGILSVKITVPADIVGEITQEELDQGVGESYLGAKLNDDGSVTYKLTKAQHQEMLSGIKTSVDEGINSIINDKENYSISAVTYNEDFTEFQVTIEGEEIGLGDYFSALLFYMYGGLYGTFTGNAVDNVKVEFVDVDGNVLETANSSEAG